jgi:hypothetical protein
MPFRRELGLRCAPSARGHCCGRRRRRRQPRLRDGLTEAPRAVVTSARTTRAERPSFQRVYRDWRRRPPKTTTFVQARARRRSSSWMASVRATSPSPIVRAFTSARSSSASLGSVPDSDARTGSSSLGAVGVGTFSDAVTFAGLFEGPGIPDDSGAVSLAFESRPPRQNCPATSRA